MGQIEATPTYQHSENERLRGVVGENLRVQQHVVFIGHRATATAGRGQARLGGVVDTLCARDRHGGGTGLGERRPRIHRLCVKTVPAGGVATQLRLNTQEMIQCQ